jgi:hypothetical protein
VFLHDFFSHLLFVIPAEAGIHIFVILTTGFPFARE